MPPSPTSSPAPGRDDGTLPWSAGEGTGPWREAREAMLEVGTRLGVYEIAEPIGSGGMGEVYRARDTKLERDVAIKVLPGKLAQHPMWLSRFEREARLLAQMNHPRIAALYGLERLEELNYLVMELVPGETLAERIAQGPIPVETAIPLFSQLADALEAAHDKGIVHRDLKPSNIKLAAGGDVKVLDFGVAKALNEEHPEGDAPALADTARGRTLPGLIVGTAAYMSPEQARGDAVDRRTDIWSFGCCLYEALTARRAFDGRTISDTVAATLTKDPDWNRLPTGTPPGVRRLLARCLKRERNRRIHDIADARIELQESAREPEPERPADPRRRPGRGLSLGSFLLGALAGLVLGLFAAEQVGLEGSRSDSKSAERFAVSLPEGSTLGTDTAGIGERPAIALSPDGSHLVYVSRRGGRTELVSRSFDELSSERVSETRGANAPFFSPDGKWVGFLSDGEMRKVSVEGDLSADVQGIFPVLGASWCPDGGLVYSEGMRTGLAILRIQGDGPETLTVPDPERGEQGHLWPEVLPSGRAVLFTSWMGGGPDTANLELLDLKSGERRRLLEGGSFGRYSPSGHVLYVRERTLFAVPFDEDALRLEGPPVPVLTGVRVSPLTGAAQFSIAADGTLAYVPSHDDAASSLSWVGRNGDVTHLPIDETELQSPRLSPDGTRLAVAIRDDSDRHLWMYDLRTGTRTRLTFEGDNHSPVWSPDGTRIAFAADRAGVYNVYMKRADGSEEVERLTDGEHAETPTAWFMDGESASRIVFHRRHPMSGLDVWTVTAERGDGAGIAPVEPLLQTELDESMADVSPDGRWLAYVSNESGIDEVYVTPRAKGGAGGKLLLSSGGGSAPTWGRAGREIYYRTDGAVMVASIVTSPDLSATAPTPILEKAADPPIDGTRNYDVTPDGSRFLMVFSAWRREPTEIGVVFHWFTDLERLAPAAP